MSAQTISQYEKYLGNKGFIRVSKPMLDLVLCVAQGIMDISYWHLGGRFIICILIMLLSVWINSFYMELHPDAYRDAVRSVFYIYPVIIIGGLIIDSFRTAKANWILKKHLSIGL